MDLFLFAVLISLLVFISYQNISLYKRYKRNSRYIEAYKKVLHCDEDSYEVIKKYINEEESLEFKHKGYIIQLFSELDNGKEYASTVKAIDLKQLFYTNGKLDNSQVKLNSDSYIFIILNIAKAYEKGNKDAIELLSEKLDEIKILEGRLEYQATKAFIRTICKDGDLGIPFMRSLLDGTYTEYQYDKNMIGLYKRTAATALAFLNEEFDEYFKNDLHNFAETFVGGCLLKSLGIYEKYKPVNEAIADIKEENKE